MRSSCWQGHVHIVAGVCVALYIGLYHFVFFVPLIVVLAAHSIPTARLRNGDYLVLQAGKSVDVECLSTGFPPPKLQWFRSDAPSFGHTGSSEVQAVIVPGSNHVVRLNASHSLAGLHNLTCRASNTMGPAESKALVLVQGTLSFFGFLYFLGGFPLNM